MTRVEDVQMMVDHLGADLGDTRKEVNDTKGENAHIATYKEFLRSVFWSNKRPTMMVIRLRCNKCGTRLSAYICSTWWVSRSSLTRTPTMGSIFKV